MIKNVTLQVWINSLKAIAALFSPYCHMIVLTVRFFSCVLQIVSSLLVSVMLRCRLTLLCLWALCLQSLCGHSLRWFVSSAAHGAWCTAPVIKRDESKGDTPASVILSRPGNSIHPESSDPGSKSNCSHLALKHISWEQVRSDLTCSVFNYTMTSCV